VKITATTKNAVLKLALITLSNHHNSSKETINAPITRGKFIEFFPNLISSSKILYQLSIKQTIRIFLKVLQSNTFKKILDLDLSVKRCRNQTPQSFEFSQRHRNFENYIIGFWHDHAIF
jgi:hypothetical protein